MKPINLIFDSSNCAFLVEQTHLVGLRFIYQKSSFLQVVDDVFCHHALRTHHLQLQVTVFGEDQQLQGMVELTFHLSLRAALRKHSYLPF